MWSGARSRLIALALVVLIAGCESVDATTTAYLPERITFTGNLIGAMSLGDPASCGALNGTFSAGWSGAVIGVSKKAAPGNPWTVDFSIAHFHGRGKYTLVEQVNSGDASLNTGGKKAYILIFGTVAVNDDERSGTFSDVELALPGRSSTGAAVVMNGAWTCG